MGRLAEIRTSKTVAHVAPLLVFMGFLIVPELLDKIGFFVANDYYPWYRRAPRQWLYPLQTIVALGVLFFFWRHYEFKPVKRGGIILATAAALVGIAVWIVPGHLHWQHGIGEGLPAFLGFADRNDGFDPSFIRDESPFWFGAAVFMRFVRMVVVVALVEEIFWRGFLMRYVLDHEGDFWKQPFGKASLLSFVIVTGLFTLAHAPVDYGAALVYGALTYGIAVRTKSLFACVWMHAVANLALGIYVMATGQWGYW